MLRSRAQGVKFRAFAGPADFEAMVACANASFAADQTGFFCRVEDVARDYAAFTSCVPAVVPSVTQSSRPVDGV